jgi:homoserine O-succinyltransferase
MDSGRIPTLWEGQRKTAATELSLSASSECIRVGLVNNMPDAALEDTEAQFYELLDCAAGETPVHLQLFSLPNVPRSEKGLDHLKKFYSSTEQLLNSQIDAIIVTGTEPRQPDLRNEPYWPALTELLDWAAENTHSTILSCLAAHAGVLHSDGIERQPFAEKRFGVFEFVEPAEHELTNETPDRVRFPHSRWNDLPAQALRSCGYTVLTESAEAGVDSFIKNKGKSLFVHFQGHPEYGAQTLMKEYRRDVRRFLRGERETYPNLPCGYFGEPAVRGLKEFRESVQMDRREGLMSDFPETLALDGLAKTWHSSATVIYGNWLRLVASAKAQRSGFFPVAAGHGEAKSKTSARP